MLSFHCENVNGRVAGDILARKGLKLENWFWGIFPHGNTFSFIRINSAYCVQCDITKRKRCEIAM